MDFFFVYFICLFLNLKILLHAWRLFFLFLRKKVGADLELSLYMWPWKFLILAIKIVQFCVKMPL